MKQNIIQSIIRRGLSFVFLSLLMPLGVGAQTTNYDLWIGNTQVTSDNASNIQAQYLTAGTAVFNANTNTLTLTGATIGYGGVQSGLENLTIVFNGTNTIESYIGANSQVAGTHNLTLQSGSEGSTMYLDNSIGNSIIDGFDNLSLDGLYVSSGSPFAYNATAKQYRSVQYSGIVIQKATITTVPHYALWVGSVQVSDENKSDLFPNDPNEPSLAGKVSFNSTNNTLSLQDVNLDYNVLNHLSNLTISVSGDCKIGSGDSATAVRNTYPNGTLTLKSTGDGNQLAFNNSRSVRDFSSIELTGLNWDDNYSYESAIFTEQQVEYVGMHLLKSDGTEAAKAVATTGTPYPLWVAGIRVTSINASNITGNGIVEGEVTFDGVNTLILTYANLSGPIETSLANLIVEIDRECSLSVDQYAFIANESTCKITFATKNPENSSITVSYVQSAPFSGFADGNIIFTNDLEGKIGQSDYVIAVPNDSYGFSVEFATGAVEVTKKNRLTIGDGVMFDGQNTLILTNAVINSISISANHNLTSGLTIYLKGTNKINNNDNNGIIYSGDPNLPLTYATGDGSTAALQPGTLECSYYVQDAEHPEVMHIYDNFSSVTYNNNLSENQNTTDHKINIAVVMTPIVTKEYYEAENKGANGQGIGQDIESRNTAELEAGILVNKILYTLPDVDDGYLLEDSKKLVAINSSMTDADANTIMAAVINGSLLPGTPDFAIAFHGMTFLLPAGNGDIVLDVNTNQSGELHVKVGNNDPVIISGTTGFEERRVPYALTEESYVFLYSVAPVVSSSRHRAPGRKMANTTTLKSVKVSARSVAATPPPVLMPKVLTKDDVAAAKSGNHITITDTDVTDYADNAFEGLTGITYVDLSATSITGKKIDRKELPDDATVFLPASNDDNSEKNIVIAGVCNDLQLNEGADFEIPSDFTAVKASLSRNFSSDLGKNCTVCVPFALDNTQAAELGTFYTLSAHSGNTITMESVDATEANKAYMFKPVKETFSAEMVDVKKADPVRTTVSSLSFLGTYQQITGLNSTADFVYYCFMQTGPQAGKFVKITDAVTVNPFRAYMELLASESLARVLDLNFGEGGATGIGSLTPNPSSIGEGNVGFYDLQGRRVLYPKKGLYILNGKKVIIK